MSFVLHILMCTYLSFAVWRCNRKKRTRNVEHWKHLKRTWGGCFPSTDVLAARYRLSFISTGSIVARLYINHVYLHMFTHSQILLNSWRKICHFYCQFLFVCPLSFLQSIFCCCGYYVKMITLRCLMAIWWFLFGVGSILFSNVFCFISCLLHCSRCCISSVPLNSH